MNKHVKNRGVFFVVAIFAMSLIFPSVTFAGKTSDPFGDVVTFVPEFYRQGEDLGSVSFKGIFDLSDDTTVGNAWFDWGETSSLGKRTSSILVGNSEVFLAHYISSLDIDDFYYYRAVAQESDGEYVYGDIVRFRIIDGYAESLDSYISDVGTIVDTTTASYPAPVALTMVPQIINDTTVIIRGEAKSSTSINTSGYFRWGTTPNLTSQTPIRGLGIGTFGLGFTETLTGLVPGTVYYYRAEVIGPGGRSVGSVLAFTTNGGLVTGFNQPDSNQATPAKSTQPTQQTKTYTPPIKTAPQTTKTKTIFDTLENKNNIPSLEDEKESKIDANKEDTRGFWSKLFGLEDKNNKTTTTTTKGNLSDISDAKANGQGALIVSNGGFFPDTIFGWIILIILIVLLVVAFVYVQTLHEQLKALREERERNKNGNGFGVVNDNNS